MNPQPKHLGFTGTRKGMTEQQQVTVRHLLAREAPDCVHHGAAVGADADFARLADAHDVYQVAHPCTLFGQQSQEAILRADRVEPTEMPLVRTVKIKLTTGDACVKEAT